MLRENRRGAVIATGGGIVARKENRELLHTRGVSVYLAVNPATALERLAAQHEALLAAVRCLKFAHC